MTVNSKHRYVLTEDDLDALEIGAGILGTGGGGNPYIGKLRAREAMRAGYPLSILPMDRLPDDALCAPVLGIGAPTVSFERLKEGREGIRALRSLEAHLGVQFDAVVCEEIGGGNSMEPLISAGLAGLPVVDCDGMGRAFPEMDMTTFAIYGHRSTPSVMCDLHGNTVLFQHAPSERWHERMARACVSAQGGSSTMALAPMIGSQLKQIAIPGSYTRAIRLGRAVLEARRSHSDPVETVCRQEGGQLLYSGKVVGLQRETRGSFVVGDVRLRGIDGDSGSDASITIQNENLVFRRDGRVILCVPDLIIVLDTDTGEAITTEMLAYGQRVAVIGLPCHPLLATPEALDVVGPKAFGLVDVIYSPLAPADVPVPERTASPNLS